MYSSTVCLLLIVFILPYVTQSHGHNTTFVIVGAGTAGSVLAARLCKSLPRATILLLERARPRTPQEELLVRAVRFSLVHRAPNSLNEAVETVPNPGLQNRTVRYLTGNTLGGSSSINGMQWTVPSYSTVSRWGIRGLTAHQARRLYQKASRRLGIMMAPPELWQKYQVNYTRAAHRIGVDVWKPDFVPKFGKHIWNIRLAATQNGRRVDSYTAYAARAIAEEGCADRLKLVQNANVDKVILEKRQSPAGNSYHRAIGVRYTVKNGQDIKTKYAYATEEVLLCAGSIGTPTLLQRSGIGPPPILRDAHVEPLVDLPVGMRVQGRPISMFQSLYAPLPLDPANNASLWNAPSEQAKWLRGEPSLLGVSSSFCNGNVRRNGYFASGFLGVPGVGLGTAGLSSSCLMNPRSFGKLFIKGGKENGVHLDLNLFGTSGEKYRMVKCLGVMRQIHNEMRKDGFPTTNVDSDALFKHVTANGNVAHHLVGGCPVGDVLKSDLRVKYVPRLRVVDCSALKRLPLSAGPLSSTYMLAEFASEKLHDKYSGKYGNGGIFLGKLDQVKWK